MAERLAYSLTQRSIEPDSHLPRRLTYTLSNRRSRLHWTSFIIADDVPSAIACLATPAEPSRRTSETPSVVFVFIGQGAQWAGMGRELMA